MQMTKMEKGIVQQGDYIKMKSNVKATPVSALIGYKIEDLAKFIILDCPDFEGIFRPKEKPNE